MSVCTTISADDKEKLDTGAIRPMAASARGEMVGARVELLGARGELLGARGGCGTDLHCSQGGLWLLEVFGARGQGCSDLKTLLLNQPNEKCSYSYFSQLNQLEEEEKIPFVPL